MKTKITKCKDGSYRIVDSWGSRHWFNAEDMHIICEYYTKKVYQVKMRPTSNDELYKLGPVVATYKRKTKIGHKKGINKCTK